MSDEPNWHAPRTPTPFEWAANEPGIGAVERTRRLVHVHAYMREHMAFNLWRSKHSTGHGINDAATWRAMSDAERAEHEARMMEHAEAYWAAEEAKPRPPQPPDDDGGGEPVPVPLRRIA